MANVALTVQYKGKHYCGFQRQPDVLSVQEVLEEALSKTFKENISVVASGRTDAGVHALGQVVNFHVETTIDIGNMPKVINYHLPRDISIVDAKFVDENFSARFDAKSKVYKYVIYNNKNRSGVYDEFSFNFPHKLDIELMKSGVMGIIGTHDFTSFMGRDSVVKDGIRTIYSIDIQRCGDFVEITFHGKSFLRNMIRIIVGSLCDIGRGKLPVDFLENSLIHKDRSKAGFTAPAQGLFLIEVRY